MLKIIKLRKKVLIGLIIGVMLVPGLINGAQAESTEEVWRLHTSTSGHLKIGLSRTIDTVKDEWWTGIDGNRFVTSNDGSSWIASDDRIWVKTGYALHAFLGIEVIDNPWYTSLRDDYSFEDQRVMMISTIFLLSVQISGRAFTKALYSDIASLLNIDEDDVSNWLDKVEKFLAPFKNLLDTTDFGNKFNNKVEQIIDNIQGFEATLSLTNIGLSVIALRYLEMVSGWPLNYALTDFEGMFVDEPPAQVTGLTATPITHYWIILEWTANTESDIADYRIYRYEEYLEWSIFSGWELVQVTEYLGGPTSTNANSVFFSEDSLAASTTYTYKVSAVDLEGNEGEKVSVSVTTLDQPPPPPPSGGGGRCTPTRCAV